MSLLMQALKKAEENQQNAQQEAPSLGELVQELSLDAPEPPPVRNEPAGGFVATPRSAASLFAARKGGARASRKGMAWVAGVGALLLAGGGLYLYLAIQQPPLTQFPVSPRPLGETPAAPSPPVREVEPERPAVRIVAPPAAPPREMQLAARDVVPETADEPIRISRGGKPSVDSGLTAAWRALQDGRLDEAYALYQQQLQAEPRDLDALLGMAVVSGRQDKPDESLMFYTRALEVAPGNAVAQAGLLALVGASDPAGSEARLRQLLARQPAAFLYFALGNLLAAQSRWSEAQQAFFDAYRLDVGNPDHAFNLAVGLEHLGQSGAALNYYRRALDAMRQGRSAGFERAVAEARIARLQGGD